MVKGERALSAEEQEALCRLIKRHIDTHVSGSPACLLTLETKKHEEVVTKGVLKKHKEILVQIFSVLPRKLPSASSIRKAFMNALGPEDPSKDPCPWRMQ